MNISITRSIAAASLVLAWATVTALPAYAQTPAPGASSTTRAQVKMDRDTFLAMARWDESTGNWVLKDDMPMPAGVPTRAEVKAMRDKFLSMNTWNDSTSQYVPVTGAPRDMSKLTRAQVKAETTRFLKMYRFSENGSEWVLRNP
jgi:hypothetical protein